MTLEPVKIDVSAEVDKASIDKLIDAVVDLFSPATEGMGLLGDAVRIARVEVAAGITRRAKAIADSAGLRLKAPPLKFLVPFFEAASLEGESSGELREMWSRLLVSAGGEFTSAHVLFARILRELTETEADLFRRICEVSRKGDWPTTRIRFLADAEINARITNFYSHHQMNLAAELKPKKWASALRDHFEQPGLLLDYISVCKGPKGNYPYVEVVDLVEFESLGRRFDAVSFELLKSLGLLAPVNIDEMELCTGHILWVEGWVVPRLGEEFYFACVADPKADRGRGT